jgi:hypothetical protein
MSNDEAADGIEVAATMKSLALLLHQIVLGNREATPDDIHYYYMRHVSDLFQFARVAATTTKLQMILVSLQDAKSVLEQGEDAESLLKNAWHLMRKVVSGEDIEKIAAIQIELRRGGMDPIFISEPDVWEQANRLLQGWSTPENEDQRVEYIVSYGDGFQDRRWFKLPLFDKPYSGKRRMIGPEPNLGERVIGSLNKSVDLGSEQQDSFDAARHAALAYLRQYEIGGSAYKEAVTEAIIKIQDEQWRPSIAYRRWLHSEHNQRNGSL